MPPDIPLDYVRRCKTSVLEVSTDGLYYYVFGVQPQYTINTEHERLSDPSRRAQAILQHHELITSLWVAAGAQSSDACEIVIFGFTRGDLEQKMHQFSEDPGVLNTLLLDGFRLELICNGQLRTNGTPSDSELSSYAAKESRSLKQRYHPADLYDCLSAALEGTLVIQLARRGNAIKLGRNEVSLVADSTESNDLRDNGGLVVLRIKTVVVSSQTLQIHFRHERRPYVTKLAGYLNASATREAFRVRMYLAPCISRSIHAFVRLVCTRSDEEIRSLRTNTHLWLLENGVGSPEITVNDDWVSLDVDMDQLNTDDTGVSAAQNHVKLEWPKTLCFVDLPSRQYQSVSSPDIDVGKDTVSYPNDANSHDPVQIACDSANWTGFQEIDRTPAARIDGVTSMSSTNDASRDQSQQVFHAQRLSKPAGLPDPGAAIGPKGSDDGQLPRHESPKGRQQHSTGVIGSTVAAQPVAARPETIDGLTSTNSDCKADQQQRTPELTPNDYYDDDRVVYVSSDGIEKIIPDHVSEVEDGDFAFFNETDRRRVDIDIDRPWLGSLQDPRSLRPSEQQPTSLEIGNIDRRSGKAQHSTNKRQRAVELSDGKMVQHYSSLKHWTLRDTDSITHADKKYITSGQYHYADHKSKRKSVANIVPRVGVAPGSRAVPGAMPDTSDSSSDASDEGSAQDNGTASTAISTVPILSSHAQGPYRGVQPPGMRTSETTATTSPHEDLVDDGLLKFFKLMDSATSSVAQYEKLSDYVRKWRSSYWLPCFDNENDELHDTDIAAIAQQVTEQTLLLADDPETWEDLSLPPSFETTMRGILPHSSFLDSASLSKHLVNDEDSGSRYGVPSKGHPNASVAVRERMVQLSEPFIRVQRNGEVWDMLPSAAHFWEPLGLAPASGPKDITAVCLTLADSTVQACAIDYLDQIRATYHSQQLGSLTIKDISSERSPAVSAASHNSSSSLEDMFAAYRHACVALGSNMAKSQSVKSKIVVFVTNPSGHPESLTLLCTCFHLLVRAYTAGLPAPNTTSADIKLRILPTGEIADPYRPVVLHPRKASVLAHQIYNSFLPESTLLASTDLPIRTAPSLELAPLVPRYIPFSLNPDPPAHLLLQDSIMHIAYAISSSIPDQYQWLTAAWIDNTGAHQAIISYSFRDHSFEEIANEIWNATIELLAARKVRWRVLVCRAESVPFEEREIWESVLQKDAELEIAASLLAVHTSPSFQISVPTLILQEDNFGETSDSPSKATPEISDAATPASVPTPTAMMPSPDARPTGSAPRLHDPVHQAWALLLAHRPHAANNSSNPILALSSGLLLKRISASDADSPAFIQVDLLWTIQHNQPNAHLHLLEQENVDKRDKDDDLLAEVLGMYQGLALLAKLKGLQCEKRTIPWHVLVAEKAVRGLARSCVV